MSFNLLQRYVHSPKELIPGFRKILPLPEIYSILPYFIISILMLHLSSYVSGQSVNIFAAAWAIVEQAVEPRKMFVE